MICFAVWLISPCFFIAAESVVAVEKVRERPRRVLVVHGWDEKEAEKPRAVEVDTMTAELFQAPLEWLGYEADYLNIGHADVPAKPEEKYAAILFDAETDIPLAKEPTTVSWLLAAKERGLPLLFTGEIPFDNDDAKSILAAGLGLRGSLQPVPRLARTTITTRDEVMMKCEAEVTPRTTMFHDLVAPEKSQIILGLGGVSANGGAVRYDPVFLSSWGGAWLEPYIIFRASADSSPFYMDPYRFLGAWLSRLGPLPAPDTTTRDGRRIFYSHIDGDGFASFSNFKGHPYCAEMIRDRILKEFPFPVTVSIIEAEVRALAKGYKSEQADQVRDLARSIFALPNVQIASHSFSHPYQWDMTDPNPGLYEENFMPMKAEAAYEEVDVSREIRGSIEYIERELAPPGRKIELMLWSGNCRPGERALSVCRELGIENMNGGNTIVSRRYPGIAGIAPRVMPWNGELQIHAANQNEFMYANGWNGPFYGGFADVIDTFERTEQGRRLKPVNVYYHFYSATNLSSLRALEKIHRWCSEQPLHAITALEFARITRDAWGTRVFDIAPRHWRVVNQGHCRTFRLPKYLGVPDIALSSGVTGYTEHGDSLHIHTRGLPETEIVIADPDKATPHLRLASSSAEIAFSEFDVLKAAFEVKDLRPVQVEFAGLPAKAVCQVTINDTRNRLAADDDGVLKLALPATARVTLDASRSRYALLR
jgi:hypothetical protein